MKRLNLKETIKNYRISSKGEGSRSEREDENENEEPDDKETSSTDTPISSTHHNPSLISGSGSGSNGHQRPSRTNESSSDELFQMENDLPAPVSIADEEANVTFINESDDLGHQTNVEGPLHKAAKDGDEKALREILRTFDSDSKSRIDYLSMVNKPGAGGRTALHRATQSQSPKCVELLLEFGADPNARDSKGRTPLYWACLTPSINSAVIDAFLGHPKTSFSIVSDDKGWSPLHAAASIGNEALLSKLIEMGAQADLKDKDGMTPADIIKSLHSQPNNTTTSSANESSEKKSKKFTFGFRLKKKSQDVKEKEPTSKENQVNPTTNTIPSQSLPLESTKNSTIPEEVTSSQPTIRESSILRKKKKSFDSAMHIITRRKSSILSASSSINQGSTFREALPSIAMRLYFGKGLSFTNISLEPQFQVSSPLDYLTNVSKSNHIAECTRRLKVTISELKDIKQSYTGLTCSVHCGEGEPIAMTPTISEKTSSPFWGETFDLWLKNGPFEQLLIGVWSIVPRQDPFLIGYTVFRPGDFESVNKGLSTNSLGPEGSSVSVYKANGNFSLLQEFWNPIFSTIASNTTESSKHEITHNDAENNNHKELSKSHSTLDGEDEHAAHRISDSPSPRRYDSVSSLTSSVTRKNSVFRRMESLVDSANPASSASKGTLNGIADSPRLDTNQSELTDASMQSLINTFGSLSSNLLSSPKVAEDVSYSQGTLFSSTGKSLESLSTLPQEESGKEASTESSKTDLISPTAKIMNLLETSFPSMADVSDLARRNYPILGHVSLELFHYVNKPEEGGKSGLLIRTCPSNIGGFESYLMSNSSNAVIMECQLFNTSATLKKGVSNPLAADPIEKSKSSLDEHCHIPLSSACNNGISYDALILGISFWTSKKQKAKYFLGQTYLPLGGILNNATANNILINTCLQIYPQLNTGEVGFKPDIKLNEIAGKIEGNLRVKISYTEDLILPLSHYEPIINWLETPETWNQIYQQKDYRDDYIESLIRYYASKQLIIPVLLAWTDCELQGTEQITTLFRANSVMTKAFDLYLKLVGQNYLKHCLQETVDGIYDNLKNCELNPQFLNSSNTPTSNGTPNSKSTDAKIASHVHNLIGYAEVLFTRIYKSCAGGNISSDSCTNSLPSSVRVLFSILRHRINTRFPESSPRSSNTTNSTSKNVNYTCISAFLFLRFLCPAILNPKLFNLRRELPNAKSNRSLTLLAKLVQSIANLAPFGEKEPYMMLLNNFVNEQMPKFMSFINKICTARMDDNSQVMDEDELIQGAYGTLELDIFSTIQTSYELALIKRNSPNCPNI